MSFRRPGVMGVVHIFLVMMYSSLAMGQTSARDSLTLQQPQDIKAWAVMHPTAQAFTVYLTFDDIPNSDTTGAIFHEPDLQYWSAGTDDSLLSMPTVSGFYLGDIDRTIKYLVIQGGGEVGVDSMDIRFSILGETHWSNVIHIDSMYTPGTIIDSIFIFEGNDSLTLDLGLQLSFSEGIIDFNATFSIGCEDFEGFHIWRGIEPDGSDLVIIGEVSKEEAFNGFAPGGSIVDSLYFFDWIPALRDTGFVYFPQAVECLGNRLDLELEDNEFFWADCNVFNGFTYYYAVTTYDRGYNIASGTQGLNKVESCLVEGGVPWACREDLVPLTINVRTQDNLSRIYAVPNPYRTGGSRFTVPAYRNYPDESIRFVNVPDVCTIKIYTVAGDLIWESEHDNPNSGNIEWDVRNSSGEDVASGIYVYRIEDPNGQQVYGRLVIIR